MKPPEGSSPSECANCGAAIPRRAKACPECGADERTGWRENDITRYDGLDLPDSAYIDSDETEAAVAPRRGPRRTLRAGLRWYWLVVAFALFAALVLGLISFR